MKSTCRQNSFVNTISIYLAITLCGLLLSYTSFAETLKVGTATRTMVVHAPSGIAQNRPLVISLHGMGQGTAFQQETTKWNDVADTAKFVVVYPEGSGGGWDIGGTSDLDFILAVIDDMYNKYKIDKNRVYLSGFSMGGMMTYHAANNIADKIAAFAPVSGYMSTEHTSSRPIPLIHVHGTGDDVVPYEPGNSPANGKYFPGILSVVEGWAQRNSCASTPVVTTPYPVGTNNTNSKKYWGGGENGTEVVLLSLAGKGHWHSNDPAGVYTTTEIWNFVKRYSLTGSTTNATPSVVFTSKKSFTAPATIPITVDFSDPDEGDSVVHITYFNGNEQIVDKWVYPFTFNMENMDAGKYTIAAVAYDTKGNSSSDTTVITVNPPQAPYSGTAQTIPGTIQFENYDVGGNGFAYYDDSKGSESGVDFRTNEDVDIEVCTDADGGYNVGYATSGEWLEYTVTVETTGVYNISLRSACNGDGRTISLSSDGVDIAKDVAIPNTGGWQAWEYVPINGVSLEAGTHVLRVTVGTESYVNLNYMTFTIETTAVNSALKYEMNGLAVYPNPLHDNGVIKVPQVKDAKIIIYASNGEVKATLVPEKNEKTISWKQTGITESDVYTVVLLCEKREYARIQVYVIDNE